jgi:hypothetical protein
MAPVEQFCFKFLSLRHHTVSRAGSPPALIARRDEVGHSLSDAVICDIRRC